MVTHRPEQTQIAAARIVRLLLADVDYLHLDHITSTEEGLTLVATSRQRAAPCPRCGHLATREHSRYTRHPDDLPCAGQRVRFCLHVRRFFCDTPDCPQRTFAERLPGVVKAFARRTERLAKAQSHLGLHLGGEAGARNAARHAMPTSPDTLLRLARHSAMPTAVTPAVLGVDDWAWKKGQRYGTILVDLEQHRVVDLLPDRTAELLATWLQAHPGVQVISRDRGGNYADGAGRGAPDAIQVADRWHLLLNLREALERLLTRKHRDLPTIQPNPGSGHPPSVHDTSPAQSPAATSLVPGMGHADSQPVRRPHSQMREATTHRKVTRSEQRRQQRRARRLARYEAVVQLRAQGASISHIARQCGMARRTVRHYLQHGAFPEITPGPQRPSLLDRFEPYLLARWQAGCQNAVQLYREICQQGYRGSRPTLARWAARRRPFKRGQPGPCPPRRLSPGRAVWWFMRAPHALTPQEHETLTKMRQTVAELNVTYALVQEFVRMVRERTAAALDSWIARARASGVIELRSFAIGLHQDLAAVKAGLSLPWSNGQVEGQINRLKLIKRSMYGRASFALLRQRVLAPT